MVQVASGTVLPLNTDQLNVTDFFDGTVTSRTSTSLVVDLGDGYIVNFAGQGFTYDSGGNPTGGTITGITDNYNGQLYFQISGMNTAATQFAQWVSTGANTTARATILGGNDAIGGGPQNDLLNGYEGANNIAGGAGADTLIGGSGNDHLYGQSANGGSDGADSLSAGAGSDYLQGNAGNDTIDGGAGSDRIQGGDDNDSLMGGLGNDSLNGNKGADVIDAGDGNDYARGGQGDDSITGGAGDDTLAGDKGFDTLTGGAGNDTFVILPGDAPTSGGTETITDFTHGTDRLGLGFVPAAILTGTAQSSQAAAVSYAQTLLDGHAGDHEVAVVQVGSDTFVMWSDNGGATINEAVKLTGVTASTITSVDFI